MIIMSGEINKPNDIFAAILQKPNADIYDLAASNMTPANTQLLTIDDYKKSSKVQQMFTDDKGVFDDMKFKQAYASAAKLYNDLDTDNTLAKSLEYDPLDFTAPVDAKTIDVRPIATKEFNPFKTLYGRTGVYSVDQSDLSLRELAQQGKVFDTKENKWLDKSANELGLFDSFFGDTLVYAQWDEDGYEIDPISKQKVAHKKGDWKFDNTGSLYVETLGDREVYGKQIVNPLDIMTTEGSAINKIDFFDSDGKTKSVTGTTMKLATEIAPYLIPGFNIYYGGVHAAMGLASVLPTFYKAGEGLFLGDNADGVETPMWKAMNSFEGYMAKFKGRSVSDEAQQSMFKYEQLGGMVSDVFSQIYEQRAMASLSKLFYKSQDVEKLKQLKDITDNAMKEAIIAGKITDKGQAMDIATRAFQKAVDVSGEGMKRSLLAQRLNLGYMALTQSSDVYSDALSAGYDRRTAGFTALLAASGQYWLMNNNNLGNWILDKSVGYSEHESKAAIRKITNGLLQEAKEATAAFEVNPQLGKNKMGSVFKTFKNKVNDLIFNPVAESEFAENILKHSAIEGIEEVTEQAAIDAAKGITDFLGYIGATPKKGSFGGFSNVFSQSGFQNYMSNFIGGALGGPMFEIERSVISPMLSGGKPSFQTQTDVYNLIANGKAQDLIDDIDKRKSRFGSTDLSPVVTKIDDFNSIYLPTSDISQADVIANEAKRYINQIQKIMYSENLTDSDEDLVKKSIVDQIYINDLKQSGVDRFVLSDMKEIGSRIVSLRTEIEELSKDPEKNKEKLSELNAELNQRREEYTEINTGLKSEYYHGLALFSLNQQLHKPYISLNVDQYVKTKYNKNYFSLTEAEKNTYDKEFSDLMDQSTNNFKDKFKFMYDSFLNINEQFSKSLKDYDADGYASVRSGFFNILHTLKNDPAGVNFIKSLERLNETNALILKGLQDENAPKVQTHTIDSNTYLSVGKFLVDNGFIEEHLSPEELQNLEEQFKSNIATKYNISESEGLTLDDQIKKLIGENNLIKKIKDQIPDLENLNIFELLQLIHNGNYEIGDKNYKLDLEEDEKGYILSSKMDIVELNNLFAIAQVLAAKVDAGHLLTEEDMTSVGLAFSENPEENIKTFSDFYNTLKTQIDTIKSEKNGLQFDEELNNLYSDYKNLSEQTRDVSDQNKEMIAGIIDSIGLPSKDLDPNTVQSAISDHFKSAKGNYEKDLAKIETIEDETTKSLAMLKLSMIMNTPEFKMKEIDDFTVSPRRKLLLHYANELLAKGEALDSEIIDELKQEKRLIDELLEQQWMYEGTPQYDSLVDDYNNIDKILASNNFKINQLYDKLKQFEIELFGWSGPSSIFDVLKENIVSFDSIVKTESDFVRTPVQLAQIDRALQTLEMVESVLTAMSTTKWGVDNLYGMNIMLNKALEKEGEAPKYEFVESQATDTIKKDLQLIKGKLEYFKYLASKNSKSIIENDEDIKNAVISGLNSQYLDKNNTLSITNLSVTINGKTTNMFSSDDLLSFESIDDQELKMIAIESKFYENFHKIDGDLNEKLNSLFSPFLEGDDRINASKKITDSRNTDLTSDFKSFEIFDWFSHLHFILAENSNNFYNIYKNNIEKELSLQEKKAPLFTQMLAIRQSIAYIKNKNIVGHISKFLQDNIEDSVGDIAGEDRVSAIKNAISEAHNFRIDNIMSILGSGGTGKSSVIANSVLRLLLNNNILGEPIDIIAIAPTHETLDILTKDLKGESLKDSKITTSTVNDLLGTILNADGLNEFNKLIETLSSETGTPNPEELNKKINTEYFIAGEGNGAILITNKFYENFIKDSSDNFTPKVIIGDEMSKISTLVIQILNKVSESTAHKYDKYYTLLMGDELQGGVKIGNQSFSTENILSPRTIKMKNPIRSRNDVRNQNNIILENYTDGVKAEALLKNGKAPSSINLGYYEKEGEFLIGDKLVNNIGLNDLRKLNPDKQIVVITENGTISDDLSGKLKSIFGNKDIDVIAFDKVQGREFDQVIVDNLNFDNLYQGDFFEKVRQFYTLMTRSKEVTLANIGISLPIQNEEKSSAVGYRIDKTDIEKALQSRLNYLNSLDLKSVEENEKYIDSEELVFTDDVKDLLQDPPALPEFTAEDEKESNTLEISQKNKNKILGYSFFNNLGLSLNNRGDNPPIKDYLNVIITLNPENENEMTWNDLKNEFKDYLTGTDLFSLNIEVNNKTFKEIINDYIKFKNELLFTKDFKGSLFNTNVSIDNQWILKRISDVDENGEVIKPIMSYGKIVNNNHPNNWIHAVGTYVTLNGEKTFITLAVTPDNKNQNVVDNINIEMLDDIYGQVSNSSNKEIPINKASIETYRGVVIPKNNETGKSSVHKVLIGQDILNSDQINQGFKKFEDIFPGSSISEIKVFKDDIEFIKEQIERFTPFNKPFDLENVDDVATLKTFRFRPYVEISYLEGNDRFTRLVMLKNNARTASDFWDEFKNVRDKNAEENQWTKMNYLITHYRSWELVFEFFKQLSPEQREQKRDSISLGFMYHQQNSPKKWTPFKSMFDSLVNWEYDPNSEDDFKKWYNSDETVKNIVGHSALYKEQEQYKWGNILHAVADYLNEDFDDFMETYEKPIYYNPILKSIESDIAGAKVAELPIDNYGNFYMDIAVESNKLLIDMESLLKTQSIKTETKAEVVESKSEDKIAKLIFKIEGIPYTFNVPINYSDSKLLEVFPKIYNGFIQSNFDRIFVENGEVYFEDLDGDIEGIEGEIYKLSDLLGKIFNQNNYYRNNGLYIPSQNIFKLKSETQSSEITCSIG